jgi:hypothetical protein
MGLTARQRYDYRDIDTWELKLVRVGHAIWVLLKQERAKKGSTGCEEHALLEACGTIWRLKRDYRTELKLKRAEQFAKSGLARRGSLRGS